MEKKHEVETEFWSTCLHDLLISKYYFTEFQPTKGYLYVFILQSDYGPMEKLCLWYAIQWELWEMFESS
jgi:hypothetical protein